jgi:hypothetical protein
MLLDSSHYTLKRYGALAIVVFHGINWHLFNIGIFPLLGVCSTVVYFNEQELKWLVGGREPDTHTPTVTGKTATRYNHPEPAPHTQQKSSGSTTSNTTSSTTSNTTSSTTSNTPSNTTNITTSSTTCLLFVTYFAVQFVVPLRHYAYHHGTDQTVGWTSEGELFGWRMMLTSKQCSGYFTAVTQERGGASTKGATTTREVSIALESLQLTTKQQWRAFQHPDYTIQLAQVPLLMMHVAYYCCCTGWYLIKRLDVLASALGVDLIPQGYFF